MKYMLVGFVFGIFLALGIKAVEWVIPNKPVQILVCISESEELTGNCRTIDEFMNK